MSKQVDWAAEAEKARRITEIKSKWDKLQKAKRFISSFRDLDIIETEAKTHGGEHVVLFQIGKLDKDGNLVYDTRIDGSAITKNDLDTGMMTRESAYLDLANRLLEYEQGE